MTGADAGDFVGHALRKISFAGQVTSVVHVAIGLMMMRITFGRVPCIGQNNVGTGIGPTA